MSYIKYNWQAINADVPIADVIERYLGETPNKYSGMIHCPSPTHNDKHPSAKIYEKDNRCKCFSCGKTFYPINIVQENVTNGNFPEACKRLVEDFGLSLSRYSDYDEKQAEEKAEADGYSEKMPLKREEAQMLGISDIYDGKVYDDNGNYVKADTLLSQWLSDKEKVEDWLLDICSSRYRQCQELIAQQTTCFYDIYAQRTEDDWKAAEKYQAIREQHCNKIISSRGLADEERELANELGNMQTLCEQIAQMREECEQVVGILTRITDLQARREEHNLKIGVKSIPVER